MPAKAGIQTFWSVRLGPRFAGTSGNCYIARVMNLRVATIIATLVGLLLPQAAHAAALDGPLLVMIGRVLAEVVAELPTAVTPLMPAKAGIQS